MTLFSESFCRDTVDTVDTVGFATRKTGKQPLSRPSGCHDLEGPPLTYWTLVHSVEKVKSIVDSKKPERLPRSVQCQQRQQCHDKGGPGTRVS